MKDILKDLFREIALALYAILFGLLFLYFLVESERRRKCETGEWVSDIDKLGALFFGVPYRDWVAYGRDE